MILCRTKRSLFWVVRHRLRKKLSKSGLSYWGKIFKKPATWLATVHNESTGKKIFCIRKVFFCWEIGRFWHQLELSFFSISDVAKSCWEKNWKKTANHYIIQHAYSPGVALLSCWLTSELRVNIRDAEKNDEHQTQSKPGIHRLLKYRILNHPLKKECIRSQDSKQKIILSTNSSLIFLVMNALVNARMSRTVRWSATQRCSMTLFS